MKAEINIGTSGVGYMRLIPETDTDKETLREFAMRTGARSHRFMCRGFQYLDPSVEFQVQPIGSSD